MSKKKVDLEQLKEATSTPEPPKGVKERVYDTIKVPLWVIDLILVVLCIAIAACLVLGYMKGH